MYLDENGLTTFWDKIKSWSTERLNKKANATDVYTKTEVDNKIENTGALVAKQYDSSLNAGGLTYNYEHIDFGSGSTKFSILMGWVDVTYVRNLCVYFPLMGWEGCTFYGCVASLGVPPRESSWLGGDYWVGEASYSSSHPTTSEDCVMIPINSETTSATGNNVDKIRVSILCWGMI